MATFYAPMAMLAQLIVRSKPPARRAKESEQRTGAHYLAVKSRRHELLVPRHLTGELHY